MKRLLASMTACDVVALHFLPHCQLPGQSGKVAMAILMLVWEIYLKGLENFSTFDT